MKNSKVYIFLDNIERYISILALFTMLAVVFWQVFSRFVLNHANSWSEELARFLNVMLVYISCSYGVRFRDHIKIDIMIKIFPAKARPILALFGEILMFVFFVFLSIKGYELAASVIGVDRKTPGIGVNAGYIYLFAPIGFTLSAIRLAENRIEDVISFMRKEGTGFSGGKEV
jgi:TRAP-type C4-dicarboxylate transport system permease small subunit